MANELTTTLSFVYTKNGITVQDGASNVLSSVAGNGLESQNPFLVPTTAGGVVLPLAGVTVPGGMLFIVNLDPTNYVMLLTAVSGTEFMRLLPGDPPFWFRLAPGLTAPAVQAHTGACNIRYKIFDL